MMARKTEEPHADRRPVRIIRAITNGLVFAGTLAVGCLLIHRQLPAPDVPEVQAKLEWLAMHANDYDTLFLGTSHVYRQIDPRVYDEAAAERGIHTRSFNAGVDGMQPPEDAYVLDQILKYRPSHLRRVYVEAGAIRLAVDPAKRGTERAVYWHDWERLALLSREAIEAKRAKHFRGTLKSLSGPLTYLGEHVALFFKNMSNLGRGPHLIATLEGNASPQVLWAALGPQENGFLGIDGTRMTEAERADYQRQMLPGENESRKADKGSPASREALARILRKVEEAGATPIVIIAPAIPPQAFRPSTSEGYPARILDFSNPKEYPALFVEENRMNASHLNTAGAAVFSRALAEKLAAADAR